MINFQPKTSLKSSFMKLVEQVLHKLLIQLLLFGKIGKS